MKSSQHAPYVLGYTRDTMGKTKRCNTARWQQTSKTLPQFGLKAATRLHEDGIASNRGSACHGEYVLELCTHRPSHHGSLFYPKTTTLTFWKGPLTVELVTGMKS